MVLLATQDVLSITKVAANCVLEIAMLELLIVLGGAAVHLVPYLKLIGFIGRIEGCHVAAVRPLHV
jgi:hypothetical protein